MSEFELIIHYDRIGESDMYNCHEVGALVRCKDCKHFEPLKSMTGSEMSEGRCERNDMYAGAGEFCSRAERSER